MNLIGKKALVTGGAKRVGRAIVLELATAGCDIAIHFRASRSDASALADAVRQKRRRATTIYGDLDSPSDWNRIVENGVDHLGGLDILINNASVFSPDQGIGEDQGERRSDWESTFRVNLLAPSALCHCARPHLEKNGGGVIVNLSDILAHRPWSKRLAYCASKAALNAATIGLAREFAPLVRVNAVAPGIALFPEDYDAATRKRLVDRVPLGREGTPDEVARLVRFLCGQGDYITGQIIAIDGGRSLVW